jgi:hypothetical protein
LFETVYEQDAVGKAGGGIVLREVGEPLRDAEGFAGVVEDEQAAFQPAVRRVQGRGGEVDADAAAVLPDEQTMAGRVDGLVALKSKVGGIGAMTVRAVFAEIDDFFDGASEDLGFGPSGHG